MKFSEFADFLAQLEETSSRLRITEILANLLKKAQSEEVDKICYLSLGRLAPFYAGIEFNLAEKLMVKVLARAFMISEEEVKKQYKKVGDLGEVGYRLKIESRKRQAGDLKVNEVYKKLLDLAQEGGQGSVERKINQMAELLGQADSLGVKYLVRIPLGRVRLGFSELTILDALSWLVSGDKTSREEIETAFNLRADIGQIAQIIKEKGLKGLKKISLCLGVPLMPALCQRLPTADEMIEKMGQVAVEPKYDGTRCLGGMTGVYVFNKGFVPIKDIRENDLVLTHLGRFKKVIAVSKRKIDKGEKVFLFQTFLGNEFKVTEGHKFLTFKKEKISWRSVEEIESRDWLVFPKPRLKTSLKPPRVLTLEDDSGYKKKIILSRNFFRFLGFWIGDGFTNTYHGNKRVGITFNARTERKLMEEYRKIVSQTLKINKISINERRGAINLYWKDWLFLKWLCKEFRINQHGKAIPLWFANIKPSNFGAFLRGWREADGTDRHSHGFRVTTKERELASFGQLLALQFGEVAGLRRETVKIPNKNYSLAYYNLIFPGTTKHAVFWENFLLIKVLKKRQIRRDPRMIVYNLQVADDESYLTSLASLHNCQIHFSQRSLYKNKNELVLFDFKPKGFIKIFTRNLEDVTYMFPDIAKAAFSEIKAQEVILDGEAIGIDPKTGKFLPFQETIKRKRKYDIREMAKEIPLKYFCFDILYKDGKELLAAPFDKRRKILETVLSSKNRILVLSPQIVTKDPERLRAFHDEQKEKGLEGVVVKKWQAPYDPGRRGFTWVKFKEEESKKGGGLADTLECVVMGYYKGKGKRAGFGIGAFLVGVRENQDSDIFLTISKIGTGLSDEQWREMNRRCEAVKAKEKPKQYQVSKNLLPDVWCDPEIVVEIQADNITVSPIHTAGLALRFPRLVRFRDLKAAEEATTLQEAKKLYQMQK